MGNYKLGVLYGDGIGPEIVKSSVDVLKAATKKAGNGTEFEFKELPMGWEGIEKYNDPVPEITKQGLKETDGWLLAPHDSAAYPDEHRITKRNPSGELRHYFDLYSNARPSKALPGCKSLVGDNVDLVIFRENTEGFLSDRNVYKGAAEALITPDVAIATGVFTRKATERIAHEAFKLAMTRRKKVTIVHKANVIKLAYGLFRDVCYEVAKQYPEVTVDDYHIDAMTAHLVRRAEDFDVIVTTNLFGDILSDLAGELVGSLGLSASLNTNGKQAMAQAAHGSAPDIGGQNVANPTSMLLSTVMLLEWLGTNHNDTKLNEIAKIMENAVIETIKNGPKTRDLGGNASTTGFTEAIIKRINEA